MKSREIIDNRTAISLSSVSSHSDRETLNFVLHYKLEKIGLS